MGRNRQLPLLHPVSDRLNSRFYASSRQDHLELVFLVLLCGMGVEHGRNAEDRVV